MVTSRDLMQRFRIEPRRHSGHPGLHHERVEQIRDFDREALAHLFGELGYKTGAEIGVERGAYSEMLCQAIPDLTLYCVDPWQAYSGYREHTSQHKLDEIRLEARTRLRDYNVIFIREYSVEAAKGFQDGELDFVYIDANHELSHVVADLTAWVPKVRRGGIVSGHDWILRSDEQRINVHVVPAVMAYVDAWGISPVFIVGSKAIVEGERRDGARSWFWVVE